MIAKAKLSKTDLKAAIERYIECGWGDLKIANRLDCSLEAVERVRAGFTPFPPRTPPRPVPMSRAERRFRGSDPRPKRPPVKPPLYRDNMVFSLKQRHNGVLWEKFTAPQD